jgi:phenylacetic acid degradation operon negative regulatory protein
MPVRALVAAGALFDLAENAVRVALARLLADGQVESDERGRYRLGAGAAAVQTQAISWRTAERATVEWSGRWIGVHLGAGGGTRAARRRETRALGWLGFRELAPGLVVRPDNLTGGVTAVRERLRALGLDPGRSVFALDDLEPAVERRARALWDTATLRRDYRLASARLAASLRRLPSLARRDALVESFLLGGRVIRQLALDPLLPEGLVPGRERRALLEAMREYDRQGRRYWAAFMRDYGLAQDRSPLDRRAGEAGGWLGAVA